MINATPKTEAEAAAFVVEARAKNQPIRVVGAGTRQSIGRAIQTEATLSTAGLSGITLYEPAEMVIGAKAGTPLAEIEAALAQKGQMLAFEPMDHRALLGTTGEPTIGGVVAGNLSGPRRIWAGACRDSLIGVRFINGAGEIIKSGGRVMKNVTGLDLVKLQAGAWGTLGLLTEVIFKVVPKPEQVVTLQLTGLSNADAIHAMSMALGSPFEITGAAHLPAMDDVSRTLLRIEGFDFSVDYREKELAKLLARFGTLTRLDTTFGLAQWVAIRDCSLLASPAEAAIWRLCVKPSEAAKAVESIMAARPAKAMFDWGGGLIWLSTDASGDAGESIIRASAKAAKGYATLIRGSESLRASIAVFEPEAAPIAAVSQRIKRAVDPDRLFNPGFMHGEI